MTRAAKNFIVLCLFSLSTSIFAHANVYPLTGPPDIYVDNITGTYNGTNLTFSGTYTPTLPNGSVLQGGTVVSISDVPGTWCAGAGPCETSAPVGVYVLVFNANASGFTITGQTIEAYNEELNDIANSINPATDPSASATTTYLSGNYIAGSYVDQNNTNIEYGELFTVVSEDQTNMNELELTFPSANGTNPASNLVGDTVFFDFDSDTTDGDMEINGTPEPATLTLLCSGLAAGLLRRRLGRKKA